MKLTTYWVCPKTAIHYSSLPPAWQGISPLTPARAIPLGWRKVYEEIASTTCTKYAFTKAVKQYSAALWEKLYDAYKTDEEFAFYWATVQRLDRYEERFLSLAEKLGATSEDIDGIFYAVDHPQAETVTTSDGTATGTTDTEATTQETTA